ncbi:ATP-binding protein [Agrobacterium vitis]|uniref:ATP-binding protein n=1 Tax=Allorhizobium ampelinum TaxID=3025782 RepID=UPI001F3BB12A|nr:ATP-binding protein [Allorhizobium ampelinum]MCF1448180.1 ATP-binding protein [Allorhizobium ampelinum]
MRLTKLKLENFRCYKDEVTVNFEDMTVIVGRNDVGKSAIMEALAIFFEEVKLDKDDACQSGDRKAVRITCEFDDLPEQLIIDTDFETSLKSEHLTNASGRLEIRKTYDGSLNSPKLSAIEAFALHPTVNGMTDLLSLKKAELIARAGTLMIDLSAVKKTANAPIRQAIWNSVNDLSSTETFVSLDKEGAKQIWTELSRYLPAFALFKSDRASTDQDAEAQDPLKAAIRDALQAVEADLMKVQAHVETEVRRIADATVQKIREMDPSLAETLNPIVTVKKWDTMFQTSITGDEGIPLNKRGSGVKRLVLLNFFRAKAERAAMENSQSSIIYAIEEPETSQHPRNQRMLMAALSDLSSHTGRQIIVTTHTPMLARAVPDSSLRFIERAANGTRTIQDGGNQINGQIAKSLGVLPDHTVRLFIGVEGKHDIAFLKGISRVLIADGVDVPDLEELEISGILIFFPFGGSNLALWTSRLQNLNRPELHIYDRDLSPPARGKYEDYVDQVNTRDGCVGLMTTRREMENFLHPEAIQDAYAENQINLHLPPAFADFDDVPTLVAQAVHAATGATPWPTENVQKCDKKISRAKSMLNTVAVSKMNVGRLSASDPNGEVISWLRQVSKFISGD